MTGRARVVRFGAGLVAGAAAATCFSTINLSCGSVKSACAQDCPDVAMLESRLDALEEAVSTGQADLKAEIDGLLLREDRTIEVSAAAGCDRLQTELASLDVSRIASGATVTIELGPGRYACQETVDIEHLDGGRIELVGGGASPEEVELLFPAGKNGIRILRSRELGALSNLTLTGGGGSGGAGVNAKGTARVSDVVVREFRVGFQAHRGVLSGSGVTATANLVGVRALEGGRVELSDAAASDNAGIGFWARDAEMKLSGAEATGNGGDGFFAESGSTLFVVEALATGNGGSGFRSKTRSYLGAPGPIASENAGSGFVARDHATLIAGSSPTATDNTDAGFLAFLGGFIRVSGAPVVSGNGTPYSPALVGDSQSGSVIVQP